MAQFYGFLGRLIWPIGESRALEAYRCAALNAAAAADRASIAELDLALLRRGLGSAAGGGGHEHWICMCVTRRRDSELGIA
jgi:hypothetical protein